MLVLWFLSPANHAPLPSPSSLSKESRAGSAGPREFEPSTEEAHQPGTSARVSGLGSPVSICIYLADQNPKLGRSLGISRMTEVVLEEMQARGTMNLNAVVSKSSVNAPEGIKQQVLPWGTRHSLSRVMTDHLHPLLMFSQRPDLWYFPKGYLPILHSICRPSVVTIHDTIVQYYADNYPDWRSNTEYSYWAHILKHTLTNADHILTVSESSKRQILHFMERHHLPEKEITITHEPCFYEAIPQPEDPLKRDYVLHLASKEPHKRTAWLIDRWFDPQNADLPKLHIVGTLPQGYVEKVKNSSRMVKLPFLDDAALQEQFMGAQALLFPSEIEGFGLPAIEAYYLGTPVCYVNGTSVEEVLGVATHVGGFDLDQPESFEQALKEVMQLPAPEIRRIGLKLRGIYAASKVVDRMMDVFHKAAGREL